jgi:protein-S-isoprenylcysteine O-methyltransferase Ste14
MPDPTAHIVRSLARYRVRLGFAAAVAALWLARPTAGSLAVGAAIAVVGEGLRIWAAGHLEKGREVTASGPYRLSRHPLYLGSAIIGVGFAVASASAAAAALVLVYLALTYGAAIRSEEAHLTEKFGAAYPEYRQGRAAQARRRFSLERAIRNREYRAAAGLLLVLALLAWKVL